MESNDSHIAGQDVITVKRADVLARAGKLRVRLKQLEREADECRRELAIHDALLTCFAPAPPSDATGLTIREMAAKVLQVAGVPMGVKSILDAIRTRFGPSVARTSLSPILKKMERRGEVRHVGDRWEIIHNPAANAESEKAK